jgi:hypothetical protein
MYAIELERSQSNSRSRPALISWGSLRIAIAMLLLIAAGAKIRDITRILAGDGLLSSQPLLMVAIGIETALAVYLLIGDRRWSWRLTIALFSAFAVTSGYAWATGQDCNCIDQQIGPGWMLLIDITVLVLAWQARPQHHLYSEGSNAAMAGQAIVGSHATADPNRTSAVLLPIIFSIVAGTLSITAAQRRHESFSAESNSGQIEYLIPELLIGKRWPLDSRVHPDLKSLETGNWMVVIVRRDCQHCQEFLDKHFAELTWHRAGERMAVFVAGSDRWGYRFDHISAVLQVYRSSLGRRVHR